MSDEITPEKQAAANWKSIADLVTYFDTRPGAGRMSDETILGMVCNVLARAAAKNVVDVATDRWAALESAAHALPLGKAFHGTGLHDAPIYDVAMAALAYARGWPGPLDQVVPRENSDVASGGEQVVSVQPGETPASSPETAEDPPLRTCAHAKATWKIITGHRWRECMTCGDVLEGERPLGWRGGRSSPCYAADGRLETMAVTWHNVTVLVQQAVQDEFKRRDAIGVPKVALDDPTPGYEIIEGDEHDSFRFRVRIAGLAACHSLPTLEAALDAIAYHRKLVSLPTGHREVEQALAKLDDLLNVIDESRVAPHVHARLHTFTVTAQIFLRRALGTR